MRNKSESGTEPEPELKPKLFQSENRNRNRSNSLRFHNTIAMSSLFLLFSSFCTGLDLCTFPDKLFPLSFSSLLVPSHEPSQDTGSRILKNIISDSVFYNNELIGCWQYQGDVHHVWNTPEWALGLCKRICRQLARSSGSFPFGLQVASVANQFLY